MNKQQASGQRACLSGGGDILFDTSRPDPGYGVVLLVTILKYYPELPDKCRAEAV